MNAISDHERVSLERFVVLTQRDDPQEFAQMVRDVRETAVLERLTFREAVPVFLRL